jgi:hypothetical protein
MARKLILALPIALVGLSACTVTGPGGPGIAPPPPGMIRFNARIVEKFGRCHTIRSLRTGRRYSVLRGRLGPLPRGTRIRVRAQRVRRLGCPHPRLVVRRLRVI